MAMPAASASGRPAARGTSPRQVAAEIGLDGHSPFTMPHFRAWSSLLVLDSDEFFALEPFQDEFVADLLARDASGRPVFSELWDIVPEGNGKSTLLALISLYFAEFQPFAAVQVAAASREQAEIIYRQAEGFVIRTARLHEVVSSPVQLAKGKLKTDVPRFTCLEGHRRINHAEGGRIQVFAAEDRTGDGLIPTLAIIDELHRHRNLALYRTWAGKLAKRNGQIVTISTAGEPGTEFEATRERIRQQADQVVRRGCFTRASTARVVMHEWAIPAKGNPEDFDLVKQANPFSGITVDGLRDKYGSPTMTLGHWLRFVCNRPTRAENAAISEPEWRAARTDEAIPEGVHVSLGIDAAWKIDPFAIAPVWWKSREERIFGEAVILTPPRDGTSLDDREVERAILSIHARNPIDVVVMDPSRAEQLARWIEDEIGAEVVEQSQTNPAKVREYKRWMEGLRRGWIRHQGDAGLTSHALNAIAYVLPLGDAKFERPSQSRHGEQERRSIDALAAASMVNDYLSGPEDAAEPMVAFA